MIYPLYIIIFVLLIVNIFFCPCCGKIIIMQSERAIFSLNGTNVTMPNRYKIRKYKACKTKS